MERLLDSQLSLSHSVLKVLRCVSLASIGGDTSDQLSGHSHLTLPGVLSSVHVFIACHLDWCNSLLYGVLENLLKKLQSLQNAATRLLTSTWITVVLHHLHWLLVRRRVELKIACLVHH